ncbi:MAG: hypothetical protein WA952_04660, partial [Lewinella sp.]
ILSRTQNVFGAVAGMIVGILVILYLSLSQVFLGPDALGNQFHTYLTIVFGTVAIFLTGFLISAFQGNRMKG